MQAPTETESLCLFGHWHTLRSGLKVNSRPVWLWPATKFKGPKNVLLQGMTSATTPALSVCVCIQDTSMEDWQFSFPMKIPLEHGFINPSVMRML